jgi:hypothetical protein
MTLWVFGDSYAEQYDGLKEQWMQQVADALDMPVKSYGKVGSTIEYTSSMFNSVRHRFNKDDVIIVALTSHNRRWFFKDYPHHTAQPLPGESFREPKFEYSPTGYAEIDEALHDYEECLKNQDVYNSYLFNFLYNINSHAKQTGIHTILLVNFFDTEYVVDMIKSELTHLEIAHEKSLTVSIMEYTRKHILESDLHIIDSRVNHLCKRNHTVLAQKIIDNIKYNKPIDLSTGFFQDFYDDFKLNDIDFYNDELFKGVVFATRIA